MGGISERMLATGSALHAEALHGEPVAVLTGLDAGSTFQGVIETESDSVLSGMLGEDPRGKRMIRFRVGCVPRLSSQDKIKTSDNKTWRCVRNPNSSFLTVDFEMIEVATALDT